MCIKIWSNHIILDLNLCNIINLVFSISFCSLVNFFSHFQYERKIQNSERCDIQYVPISFFNLFPKYATNYHGKKVYFHC